MVIIKNAIRCNRCGDEIESMGTHQFVTCSCGACSVDGGHEYLRRCAPSENDFTDISIVETGKDACYPLLLISLRKCVFQQLLYTVR